MILLALLLAATPINAKTLHKQTTSTKMQSEFRKEVKLVREDVLQKAWLDAGKGLYSTSYCIWGTKNNHEEIKRVLVKELRDLGLSVNTAFPNPDCLEIDWSVP